MSMPVRIQLSRKKGWRKPEEAIVVSRPTRWGNPFKVGKQTLLWHRSAAWPYDFYRDCFVVSNRLQAVGLFRKVLVSPDEYWLDGGRPVLPTGWQTQLRGHDLACWCPLVDAEGHPVPCHADVLLEMANQ